MIPFDKRDRDILEALRVVLHGGHKDTISWQYWTGHSREMLAALIEDESFWRGSDLPGLRELCRAWLRRRKGNHEE
jgi:hypothetical protein